jgi:MYXO-CTERM domain-containing protein
LSRYLSTVAGAVLLGCLGSVHALPSADRLPPAIAADSSATGSHQLPGRVEDDEVCVAGAIDRSNCGVADRAKPAVDATDTSTAAESQTYALMLAGLGAAGFLARRRQPLRA